MLAAFHGWWEPHTFADPDAGDLFTGLRARGIKIGVLSNTIWPRAEHERIFERDGLADRSTVPCTRPTSRGPSRIPEAFRAALDAVGVDDPAAPCSSATGPSTTSTARPVVGMRTILVPHSDIPAEQIGHTEGDPDAVVHRLGEVLDDRRLAWNESVADGGASLIACSSDCSVSYLRAVPPVAGAVVGLQLISTLAALYLPSLNADIIDNGVANGDTGYIVRIGGWMLVVSVVQIAASVAAVYFGARAAMSFGRDLRAAAVRPRGRFSAREVSHFGAPSLITRTTNDVQQVQMLVVMACTLMVAAPIMCVGGIVMALHEDLGMSWLLGVSVPVLAVAIGLIVARMVPQFRAMQERIDTVNRVLREQISGIRVVRAFVREPEETHALRPRRTTS